MTTKNQSIQALRGIAAFAVFGGHVLGMVENPFLQHIKNSPLNIFFDGQCAVLLFFTITGYFSYKTETLTLKKYGFSLIKKVTKIYPAYLLVLSIAYLLCNYGPGWNEGSFSSWGNSFWKQSVSIKEFLFQCTLILPSDSKLLNPPIWYLMVDMRLAFVLPVINLYLKNKSILLTLLLALILPFVNGIVFFACLQYYLWGMIAHRILAENEFFAKIWQNFKFRCTGLFLGVALLGIYNIIGIPEYESPNVLKILQSLGAAIVVIFCVTSVKTPVRCATFLGNISYEFYLIHFVVLLTMRSFIINTLLYCLVSFFASICLAIFIIHVSQKTKKMLCHSYDSSI